MQNYQQLFADPAFFTALGNSVVLTVVGIILAHIVLALPFCLWMFKSYVDAIPRR